MKYLIDAANFQQTSKEGILKKIQPFVTCCYEFVTLVTLGYTWIHLAQLKEACPWLMCSPWYMGLLKRIHCNRGILTSGWKIRVNWPAQFSLTHRRRTNNNCCSCATMEEAYKAPWITKTCLTSSSYPESDHRIISKPKWSSSLCMRWYSTGFCEALEDFAGQTSFRNAEWHQVTESNINLEPGHI